MDEKQLQQIISSNPSVTDWLLSVEYRLFVHLKRIQDAYHQLINSQVNGVTYSEALQFLKELQLASKDMTQAIREELNTNGIPPQEVRNVENKMQMFTIDYIFVCVTHYYQRLLHCPAEHKLKNLSALFYLVKDLADISVETPISRFYKEIIKP